MSKFQLSSETLDPSQIAKDFFSFFPTYSDEEKKLFVDALLFLVSFYEEKTQDWGESFCAHPLRVAAILAENNFDIETVIAGLLHNITLHDNFDKDDTEKSFGSDVLGLVLCVKRITGLNLQCATLKEADSKRKMVFALVDDIRVIFIKLADRLDYIRLAQNFSEEFQKQLASEVVYIWTPLANRLGMANLKIELEDLSLKYLNPDVFAHLKQLVSLKKADRELYLETVQKDLYKAANRAGINIVVHTRAKHFYSIYQKMRKKNRTAEELLDLFAVRILCDNDADCYTMIGLVHNLWKPLDGRFKDFIANPKTNGYQSIHTTVIRSSSPLEIQIRTHDMHSIAEFGVASHWLYKKGFNKDSVSEGDLGLVQDLKNLKKNHIEDIEFFNKIKADLLADSIFVFTPLGDVRELRKGATAIDFAYSVHTTIGQTIVGAKANGKIIPLSRALENTEVIEILTNPQAHPTVNQLGMVFSNKARAKIRAWLNEHENIFDIDKPISNSASVERQEDLERRVHKKAASDGKSAQSAVESLCAGSVRIKVDENAKYMVRLANCCMPTREDTIVGYVSRGRGIIIHRQGCPNFKNIQNIAERNIDVEWQNVKGIEESVKRKK